jgi:hypothetical protein
MLATGIVWKGRTAPATRVAACFSFHSTKRSGRRCSRRRPSGQAARRRRRHHAEYAEPAGEERERCRLRNRQRLDGEGLLEQALANEAVRRVGWVSVEELKY